MKNKKILWLEDQYEDFSVYKSPLFRAGYVIDFVNSVSNAVQKIREEKYIAFIFDIKVLPGEDQEWITLDKRKREEYPRSDSNLGLELLRSIFNPREANVTLDPPIEIDPGKVIVFSVVFDDKAEEISALGIPRDQIIYKSNSKLNTLPQLIESIRKNPEK